MAKGQVEINGVGYANADVSINFLGRTIEGMRSLNWTRTFNKSAVKGRGGEDAERIRNGSSRTASMTITAKEAAAIRRAVTAVNPTANLGSVKPSPMVITIVNDENVPVVHTINDVEFLTEGFTHEADGEGLEESFDLLIGDIITA